MLKIFVISLPDAGERREQAARQMDAQRLDYEFFDASDGESGKGAFESCDAGRFVLHTGRQMTPGEIGCFASHKRLWQCSVDENRPLIVMEDDFRLEPRFAEAVRASGQLIDDLHFIRLQDERRGVSKRLMTYRNFCIERYTKPPHCAMCYAITPTIAKRWLALFREFYAPVDVVLKHTWLFDNPMYCLTPYTVTSGKLSFDSMIGCRSKCDRSIVTHLRRFALKTAWQWQRLRFNLLQSDRVICERCVKSRQRHLAGNRLNVAITAQRDR